MRKVEQPEQVQVQASVLQRSLFEILRRMRSGEYEQVQVTWNGRVMAVLVSSDE